MIKRGEIYLADLSPVVGSEQGGMRPVLIVQNNMGNKYSPTVIAAAITSSLEKNKLPTHIRLSDTELGRESIILMEQIRTIDKSRLVKYMGSVGEDIMEQVDGALKISLGFKMCIRDRARPIRPIICSARLRAPPMAL